MLDVKYSSRFKKDFKTCTKGGYDLRKLQTVINTHSGFRPHCRMGTEITS